MRRLGLGAGLLLALGTLPTFASAQTPAPAAAAPAIEPEAMAALNAMGAYLRTLKAFPGIGFVGKCPFEVRSDLPSRYSVPGTTRFSFEFWQL